MKLIGKKMYDVCPICGQVVCLNKFIFGSAHVCLSPEERRNIQNNPESKKRRDDFVQYQEEKLNNL